CRDDGGTGRPCRGARARRQGDDLHRRLLQRPRPRRRPGRHHPRRQRRRPRGVRRADARRVRVVRTEARLALRHRFERGQDLAANDPEDGAEPGAAAGAAGAAAKGGRRSEPRATAGLVRWTLTALRPYSGRVALLAALLVAEIGLGALQPWPLAVVIDLLSGKPLPAAIAPYLSPYV